MRIRDQVVERSPLGSEGGLSGNVIELVRLQDGRELIHKRVRPDDDWISRATGDRGRLVTMWKAGVFDRMPATVDHAMVAVEENDDGWSVFMRDMSPFLVRGARRLNRAEVGRVLGAMAEIHGAFWGEDHDLCSIEDRYHLLSPRTIRRERDCGHSADALSSGWEAFTRHVPAAMADVILALVEDPLPVADALRECEQTLIHGDLRLDNLGFGDDSVVLLDWGERSGTASPAVELMWFLGFDALRLDCTREQVVSDFRRLYGDRVDQHTMDLAFIGGFVHLGCHFGLGLLGRSPTLAHLEGDEGTRQAAAAAELSWWIQTVDEALNRTSLA